jgi:hypothetical protein
MTSADSLEDDFLIDDIVTNEFTEETKELEIIQKKTKKPESGNYVGNSKRKRLGFDDLGIDIEPLPKMNDKTWISLIDALYVDSEKPLFVKTHSKIKILVACSSALRCLDVFKELLNSKIKIAKLFAKHKKIEEQISDLKSVPYLIGVGTPARILKIIESDPGFIF